MAWRGEWRGDSGTAGWLGRAPMERTLSWDLHAGEAPSRDHQGKGCRWLQEKLWGDPVPGRGRHEPSACARRLH